ncbi:MAG: 1-acyl-sn-glycerol-3-phosphate acyltransferase [Betaproteobacteria bacterium]|jgi:1-acyl-sn-glycerol-3-phosphate acyltransferase|nr:1-acyl-sn-glycerol-3-phosphate acyltransferase [Betaproteobacteria bacterium]MCC7215254.1 1-acyl-sn-glycerol-3-phosphate acyltransferase [Burkholderiales bacterium]
MLVGRGLCVLAKALTGARILWQGCAPAAGPRVYYANHGSHGDFALIWACLPPDLRARTRPVAGADYWRQGRLRTYVAERVIRAVLIDRNPKARTEDPIRQMEVVVDAGDSLIVFPEGTRNTTDEALLPFKSGIYHLARARPDLEFVPVWIENARRVMPKGRLLPVPLLCTLTVGAPITLQPGEDKAAFVDRTRAALLALMPAAE